ncbi:MAG: tRNA glutamyl-Q(34) synthetase GluQRS [Steroidobacteraceae bacterium]
MRYRGRFAPSPTGLLHIGSLVTALASFLDARANRGAWLIRIEDLDVARIVPGATDAILRTLERLGMQSDEPVLFQSQRIDAYRDALRTLRVRGLAYDCSCTRSELAGDGSVYPGYCRGGSRHVGPTATRFRTTGGAIRFTDVVRGPQVQPVEQLGDPVIHRRDGIAAYQLAVVIDDQFQNMTHVVRGDDLLPSTGWQILLQQALGYATPDYLHLPLVVEADGSKLSKSRHSLPVDALDPAQALRQALVLLQQRPDLALENAPVPELLRWAIANWNVSALQGKHLLPL